ncbi:MFS transporter [Tistrella mobilis]|uniref:MFS transporter n=1 Tax=Tistrella mobilis TaxID=171437 RepID=UPI0035588776
MTTDSVFPGVPDRRLILFLAGMAGLGEFAATAWLPALPAVADDFGASLGTIQTTVTVGLIAFAVANPILGPLSDRVGRRPVLIPAFVAYLAGCVIAMAAPSAIWLVLARILQAVGACAGLVVGRAIARDLYDGAALTRIMALITLVFSVAPVAAPLIGGVLTDGAGWRAIFLVAFIYAALLLPLLLRLPETRPPCATATPIAALPRNYAAMLREPGIGAALLCSALLLAALFAFLVGAPAIFVQRMGLNASTVGAFPLLTMGGFVLGTILAARLAGHIHSHGLMRIGSGVALAGALAMFAMPAAPLPMLAAMAIFDLGLGLVLPVAGGTVMAAFPARAGLASGFIGLFQIGGGAVGAGLVPATGGVPELAVPGIMTMFAAASCLCVLPRSRGPGR